MTDSNRAGFSVLLDEWRRDSQEGWQLMPHKALFLTLLAAWVALFHFFGNSTFGYKDTPSLFGWMNYAYSMLEDDRHCKYIPLVVMALFWWKRKELMAVRKEHWWPAIALVVLGLVLHLLGFLVQQTRISIVAFFVGLYGLTGLVWGRTWLARTFFPFFLFGFCFPLGTLAEDITFPLRQLATKIAVAICHALGVNVIQSGTSILEPTGKFQYEVAAACSGLRSLTAVVALCTIYGFVSFQSSWRRLAMIGAAFPLAVAGNVIRLMLIIETALLFNQSAGNYVHESLWSSLLPYLPAFAGILVLGHWIRENPERKLQ